MLKHGISYKSAMFYLFLLFFGDFALANKIIYVDDDASGSNDGSSWQNAYIYLQDALADANSSEKHVEIRVAQGIYKPDKGAGQTAGDRNATFELINDVTIAGGYAGIFELDPNEQDFEKYETILSGDLAGDDVESNNLSSFSKKENSLHIVTNTNTAILEGFIITQGNASYESHPYVANYGGGIINDTGNLTLRNCMIFRNKYSGLYNSNGEIDIKDCTFIENSYGEGGGLYNYQGSINLTNCIFEENSSFAGGGLYNNRGSFNLTNCIFSKNSSTVNDEGDGGGMYNYDTSPDIRDQKLVNCTFTENSSGRGGGFYNHGAKPIIKDCKFIENFAIYEGGGLHNYEGGNPVLNNCDFIGNIAVHHGGGISNPNYGGTNIILNNCNLCGNLAFQNGGGIYNQTGLTHVQRNIMLNNCVLYGNRAGNLGGGIFNYGRAKTSINNSILYANTATQGNQVALLRFISPSGTDVYYSSLLLKYNNIQNGDSGIYKEFEQNEVEWLDGNIDTEPLFADPGYWDSNSTPEDVNDDFWIEGDYHLKSQAGRFNPITQTWVQDNETSPCIDAGDPNSPIGYEPFPNGGRINMGAYGGTSEASKSYFGKPVCETIVAGDINGDCKVDIADLEIMLIHWLEEH